MAFRPLLSSFSPKKTLFFGEPKSTPLIFPTVHWYLLGDPRSGNMPFIIILLKPICQSRPKMSQISQNHNFMPNSDTFWFQ